MAFRVFERSERVFKEPVTFEGTVSGASEGAGSALYVDGASGSNSDDGSSWENAKLTIQAAINLAVAGDRILVAPGTYAEVVTINKAKLLLYGVGGRGSVSVAPTGANDVALTVDGVQDVSIVNIGGEGKGTGGGLHVKASAKTRRFRAHGCKLEGGAFGARLESTGADPLTVGDSIFDDCEFAWATTGLHFKVSGAGDPVTETLIRNSWFHDYAARGLHVETVQSANIWAMDNLFAVEQDGTAPTDELVKADVAGTTGFFSGNRFATPTNAAAKLAIAAGVFWAANATEAGWSTARPA